MIGLKSKKKRFSLYFLEENEVYIQDLTCYFTISDASIQKERFAKHIKYFLQFLILINLHSKEKGKLHICSRSIIFEPDDPSLSITKYFYKYMMTRPSKGKDLYSFLKSKKLKK